MSHDAHTKLIYMANQIAKFMESKPHDEGLAGLTSHINDFWEPRMRKHLFEVLFLLVNTADRKCCNNSEAFFLSYRKKCRASLPIFSFYLER